MTARAISDPGRARSVAVVGAAGHTGRFVVSELLRRGIVPIAVARDPSPLTAAGFADRGIELRTASIDDPGSLDGALAGAAAVVNCAGPFLDTAHAVASAALRAGSHYLDVTAEQMSARATFEAFDAPAREAGVVVMPAMGFFGGFADLLVSTAIGDWDAVDDIRIAIALDRWHPTRGTRLTGERNTVRRLIVADGQFAAAPQPAAEREWDFPDPFARQSVVEVPFSEVIAIARHVRTSGLRTYLSQTAVRDIRNPATPPPEPADETGLSAQRFLVDAIVTRAGRSRRIAATGRDIYGFTAPLVGEAVQRILDGRVRDFGAHPPGAVFDAADFLAALAAQHPGFTVAAR